MLQTSILTTAFCLIISWTGQAQPDLDASRNQGVKRIASYVHNHEMDYRGTILMVTSSPSISEQTGWPIGFWAAELTHPLHVFKEAGFEVDLASTQGGKILMDNYSDPTDVSGYAAHDVISLGYMQLDWFNAMLESTIRISAVDASDYDAIFLVGGQGPMYTFRGNQELESLFTEFFESGKPSAAVCHATSLLLEARDRSGNLIVRGKEWTGFADAEEAYADKAVGMRIQPYWIEQEARKIDETKFTVAAPFTSHAIRDGNLITGQQQNSGDAAARLVVEMLTADH